MVQPTVNPMNTMCKNRCNQVMQNNKKLREQNQSLTQQVQTLTSTNTQLTNQMNQMNQQNQNAVANTENYISPYTTSPQAQPLQKTCHPLTPHVTPSFQMAREIRTPYDQYWLKMYNTHSLNENYNLP